jgi:type IV pilus assembly protein PilA
MKHIQKGFTLIELMIVVAIIGILAAVAIPAYQDYIVKSKLSKVLSTLDPVKTALALYFQEQGGFPDTSAGPTLVGQGGFTPGATTTVGTFWSSLGFSVFPSLPSEVASMAVEDMVPTGSKTAPNVALILVLQNIKAGTIDTGMVTLSPNTTDNNPIKTDGTNQINPSTATTTNLQSSDTVSGASALNWYYGCKAVTGQATMDAVVKNFFKNANSPMVC